MKSVIYLSLFFFFLSSIAFSQTKNSRPVAVEDVVYFSNPGVFTVDVLANDYDPDGDSIYLYSVETEIQGLEITTDGNIINIRTTEISTYYEGIRYKIKDANGSSDDNYILLSFKEHENAPHAIPDSIITRTQVSEELNLIQNDIYNGSEDLKIYKISQTSYCDIDITPDSQSIVFSSNSYHGAISYSYLVMEKGGNNYLSYTTNFVFVDKNENAPIAQPDTFELQAGELYYLDVLINDQPGSGIEIDSVYTESESITIENNRIKYNIPISARGLQNITYTIIDQSTQLKSMPVKAILWIEPSTQTPVAIRDTFEFRYTDDLVELFPLQNDINPTENPLVIKGTGLTSLWYDAPSDRSGWFEKTYVCTDTITGLQSYTQSIHIHILPPDSIQISDLYIDYTPGEELFIDPYEGTNIPDSVSARVWPQIGKFNYSTRTYSMNYTFIEDIIYNEFDGVFILKDTIEITFEIRDGYHFFMANKYIYVNYKAPMYYSDLQVNNVGLKISPDGFHLKNIHFPANSPMTSLRNISPWMCDYSHEERKRVSGNYFEYGQVDFVAGVLADEYNLEYGEKYIRTWKISKAEIQNHILNWNQPDYEMPENIASWPSKKTVYRGKEYEAADYVDVNLNHIYDPEHGDYPKISGDEAVLYITNDGRFSTVDYLPLDSLNVDLYTLVYAFNRPESDYFHNTFFIRYKVINKSDIDYEDFRLGLYAISEIPSLLEYEYSNVIYVGCDTTKNTFFTYPGVFGRPERTNWPVKPPITMFTFLNSSMDKFTKLSTYYNSFGQNDILSDEKKYHYMNGTWDTSLFLPYPYWYSEAPLDYVLSSHPLDFGGDNQLTNPYARSLQNTENIVGTSNPHSLKIDQSLSFEYAIHFYYHPDNGYEESIDNALDNVSSLIECYQNDSIPGGGSFSGVEIDLEFPAQELMIYPNPANTILYLSGMYEPTEYSIFNLQGQLVEKGVVENQIGVAHLPHGFYLLQLRSLDGKREWTRKFIKQ